MEFVATGWCTGKWLRLNQTTKDLTFDDLEIPLVVIRLRVTGPKNTSSYASWTCLGEGWRRDGVI